jgi:hypothetical protein
MTGRQADPIDLARDEIARGIEAEHPGITVTHGPYGWRATRGGEEVARSQSAPGLRALLPFMGMTP